MDQAPQKHTAQATHQRSFSEGDDRGMAALVRAFPASNLHIADLPYRLSSWALDDPENAALWAGAEGGLLAWAVMQAPFWAIDYAIDLHAEPVLHRDILAWAEGRARQVVGTRYGRPMWFVNVFAGQADRIRDLEAAGYACQADVGEDSWSKVLLLRPPGLAIPDCPLPPGFVLRPLAGQAEVDAYVDLQRTVFETKNMTVEWRRRSLKQPEYLPNLDLVAVAPDGSLAAFCIAWLEAESRLGQIEPLGVHPTWRGQGVGQAILSEALRRLQACGAQQVCVETDEYRNPALALYESAGFRRARSVLVYRKDLDLPG
jgi:mycothiol synthase